MRWLGKIRKKKWLGTYLDKSGTPFGNLWYDDMKPFKEGLASVMNQNGISLINHLGKTVVTLNKVAGGGMPQINPFHNGLALVTINVGPDRYTNYFIDTSGHKVLDIEQILSNQPIAANKGIRAHHFSEGMLAITLHSKDYTKTDLVFVDRQGKIKFTFTNIQGFEPFTNGYACIHWQVKTEDNKYTTKSKIIDREGKEIKLVTNSTYMYVSAISPKYIYGVGFDNELLSMVFSRKNGKLIFKTPGIIEGQHEDIMLIRDEDRTFFELKDLSGRKLWSSGDNFTIYEDLKIALSKKEQVRYFTLILGDQFPNGVLELKNLEVLEILGNKLRFIPHEINTLTKLRVLTLSDLGNLVSLPIEISLLKNLEELSISDCKLLKNVETIIEKSASLKKVYLVNYDLKRGFIEQMKKRNPDLEIQSSSLIELGEESIR